MQKARMAVSGTSESLGLFWWSKIIQPARFSILFGGNFYKQQQVLGKLLNTMKWSTFCLGFCVSFIHVHTILSFAAPDPTTLKKGKKFKLECNQ